MILESASEPDLIALERLVEDLSGRFLDDRIRFVPLYLSHVGATVEGITEADLTTRTGDSSPVVARRCSYLVCLDYVERVRSASPDFVYVLTPKGKRMWLHHCSTD
ncbi:MAG: hypothetical protein AABX53_02260 [Nanoarchaeota archaeon]